MLQQLSIKNIVLIESCDIALEPGLCVLSGETGAGKSILLDALGLVLGARADAGLLRSGEAQASVTAVFDISANAQAQEMLKSLDLEAEDTLIIRRSLSADGKTRALANDQPVTASALKKLGETLVEIHGQHDQRTLMDAAIHREMLDEFAALGAKRKVVAESFALWKQARDALEKLAADLEQARREQDYMAHMHRELSQLAPEEGEEEKLSDQRTLMMQAEKLFSVLEEAIGELNGGKGVVGSIRAAQRHLTRSPLTSGEAFAPVLEALDKAAIEAEEAQYNLEKIGQDATFNPSKLDQVEERLFALKAAARKYNRTVGELPSLLAEVEGKLSLIDSQSSRRQALEKEAAQAKAEFVKHAQLLSQARAKTATKLEKAIAAELAPLKMEGTHFRVAIEPMLEADWVAAGMDWVRFECATNVGKGSRDVAYAPLNKIASGGELSRFMLALKVVLSSVRSTPTLIFDEIDTGTGGAVADAIGKRLAMLGRRSQVLVVTHLPQVAARGSQHLLVSKGQKAKKVTTQVVALSAKEREEELARMLAGETITAEARKAAQKLLEQAA